MIEVSPLSSLAYLEKLLNYEANVSMGLRSLTGMPPARRIAGRP